RVQAGAVDAPPCVDRTGPGERNQLAATARDHQVADHSELGGEPDTRALPGAQVALLELPEVVAAVGPVDGLGDGEERARLRRRGVARTPGPPAPTGGEVDRRLRRVSRGDQDPSRGDDELVVARELRARDGAQHPAGARVAPAHRDGAASAESE